MPLTSEQKLRNQLRLAVLAAREVAEDEGRPFDVVRTVVQLDFLPLRFGVIRSDSPPYG